MCVCVWNVPVWHIGVSISELHDQWSSTPTVTKSHQNVAVRVMRACFSVGLNSKCQTTNTSGRKPSQNVCTPFSLVSSKRHSSHRASPRARRRLFPLLQTTFLHRRVGASTNARACVFLLRIQKTRALPIWTRNCLLYEMEHYLHASVVDDHRLERNLRVQVRNLPAGFQEQTVRKFPEIIQQNQLSGNIQQARLSATRPR